MSEVEEDIKRYAAMGDMSLTEGGRLLIESFTRDIVSALNTLASSYGSLTHLEMMAICASLEAKLDTVHAITRAPGEEKAARDELKRTLAA